MSRWRPGLWYGPAETPPERAMAPSPTYMTAADAAWLHMERPESPMMITALLVFAGEVSREAVEGLVAERLVGVYPRFSRRVQEPSLGVGPPRWEDDPTFDLAAHVVASTLHPPGAQRELEGFVGALMSEPLPLDRPLWQIHVVQGVDGGARTALVVRIHHVIADGISLARVILAMADGAGEARELVAPPAPRGPTPFYRPALDAMRATRRAGETLWHEGVELASHPEKLADLARVGADMASAALRLLTLPQDPPTALRGRLGTVKRAAWCTPQPLPRLKATCRALGCTLNDALLAAMAGALRLYLAGRGTPADEVRAFVPVNLRPLDQPVPVELGNHFSLVVLPLPVGEATPAGRIAALKRAMDAIKASQEPAVAFGILHAMGMTPPRVERALMTFFGSKASAVMTNVPGPRAPVSLGGHVVDKVLFWVPMSAGVGLGISILSYAGEVILGVASDAGLIPDPEAIAEAWEAELEALHGLV